MTLQALMDYLQDCCSFQSEDLGVGVEYLKRINHAWVLSSWEIVITQMPQMGDNIRVNTWPYNFKGFYGYRNFTIEDESGRVLVAANSLWVFMDLERMRPARRFVPPASSTRTLSPVRGALAAGRNDGSIISVDASPRSPARMSAM